ncbi:MAG: Flp family type IVb pilin [Candidatus Sericytochromatia bacterium]|nr:Flp family type IVb pilin [Candidatus Tanganyikabacteria bacterium]
MKRLRDLLVQEDGQALTEYGLILGLLAVACVAAVTAMGTNINALLQSIATAIGGAAGSGGSTP